MTQTGLQEAKDPISQNLQKTAFMGSYLSVFHALSLSLPLSHHPKNFELYQNS